MGANTRPTFALCSAPQVCQAGRNGRPRYCRQGGAGGERERDPPSAPSSRWVVLPNLFRLAMQCKYAFALRNCLAPQRYWYWHGMIRSTYRQFSSWPCTATLLKNAWRGRFLCSPWCAPRPHGQLQTSMPSRCRLWRLLPQRAGAPPLRPQGTPTNVCGGVVYW